jgi:hypothetical protein
MTGSVLISLDCEGKWGMADDPEMLRSLVINDTSLKDAYTFLFDLFEQHKIRATFAVVGLFVAGEAVAREHIQNNLNDPAHSAWLKIPNLAILEKRTEGWFFTDLPKMVRHSGLHELASHGFSHLPFTSQYFSATTATYELESMRTLGLHNQWNLRSMVFPRNEVAFVDMLNGFGIHQYRLRSTTDSAYRRLTALLSEYKIRQLADLLPNEESEIPAGHFLNWRSGPRRIIPPVVTISRWRSILSDAAENNRCAHLWFHPHNVITGHNQRQLVSQAIELAGQYIRRGELRASTFSEVRS